MRSEREAAAPAGFIPLCVPEIRGNEWKYVKECLDTNFVSSVGPFVDRFETMLANRVGTRRAVATVNGTSALHIALLVAGIQPGDEVVLPSLTFIAPANAIRYAGAWPVFVDSEPDFWQMSPESVAGFIEKQCDWTEGKLRNKATGRTVRAILPVHILGHPVDMDPILKLAREFNLVVIEDATEALGATYKDRKVGHIGDVGCFSFNGNKIITTGGGGMLVTDNEQWAAKARYLTTQAKDDPIEFIHREIGYNYRLTNLQAAMGCAQLELLDDYIEAKRAIAARYSVALSGVPGITVMRQAPWAGSISWLYTVLVDGRLYKKDRRELLTYLKSRQVQTRPLWQPLHLSPAHKDSFASDCSCAAALNNSGLSLPCSVGLTNHHQQLVVDLIRSFQDATE